MGQRARPPLQRGVTDLAAGAAVVSVTQTDALQALAVAMAVVRASPLRPTILARVTLHTLALAQVTTLAVTRAIPRARDRVARLSRPAVIALALALEACATAGAVARADRDGAVSTGVLLLAFARAVVALAVAHAHGAWAGAVVA